MPKSRNLPAQVHPRLLRQIKRANNIDWNSVVPLSITYGKNPSITATGIIVRELADELLKAGLLIHSTKGVLGLKTEPSVPLKKEDVERQIRNIEKYCVQHGHIKGLRGERLYLGDELKPEHKEHYASYDRNLDVLGFIVHSICVITYQSTGKQKGHLIVAKRDPLIIVAKGDSNWDVLSGAIEYGTSPFETRVSEGYDEFGLTEHQMRRARDVTTITTHRTRENRYSLVREKMQVSILGLTQREAARLECHDIKSVTITDDHGVSTTQKVHSNIGFRSVSPQKMLQRLKTRKHLKNGKALAVISCLIQQGHINANDPLNREISEGLGARSKAYCRTNKKWAEHPRAKQPIKPRSKHKVQRTHELRPQA